MERSDTPRGAGKKSGAAVTMAHRYCTVKWPRARTFAPGVTAERARLIRQTADKWLNGTTIRYWFFDTPKPWTAPAAQKNVVREAFRRWKALGIGLDFAEARNRADADVRIAFDRTDGSWSYIGTDVRTKRRDPRTMNFGWSLTADPDEGMDTAIHEIGHTLGFPHEHQNPFAGIVWNEPAVYASLAVPPNRWSRATTYHNIIEKIAPDTVLYVDAVDFGGRPGDAAVLTAEDLRSSGFDTHKAPLRLTMDFVQQDIGCATYLLAVQPECVRYQAPMSDGVTRSVRNLAQILIEQLSPRVLTGECRR